MSAVRQPPFDLNAEGAVLGTMLTGHVFSGAEQLAAGVDLVADLLTPESFYSEAHRRVFEAVTACCAAGEALDVVKVAARLRASGRLDQVGGMSYLIELTNCVPAIRESDLRDYARTVSRLAQQRKLLLELQTLEAQIYVGVEDHDDFLGAASKRLDVALEGGDGEELVTMSDLVKQAFDHVQKCATAGGVSGAPTGIADLDNVLGGLQDGDVVVMAGRPGMGKSALAFSIASHRARQGDGVAVFSLEMPGQQLGMRSIAELGNVSVAKIRTARGLDKADWRSMSDAAQELHGCSWYYVDDRAGMTIAQLRSRVRQMQRACKRQGKELRLVVVDYLQLMRAGYKCDSREQEVAEISRFLKELAKTFRVAVIAVAQLNRAAEQRADKQPTIADLRESGSIEQDADSIVLLYRDDYYTKQASKLPSVVELIIGKNRNGPTGSVFAHFSGRTTSVRQLDMGEKFRLNLLEPTSAEAAE